MPKDETEDVSMTDLFRQMLFETEDERQDRLQEEYQISDEDGINKLLTSNLSCDDKMSILNREKQRIDTLRIEMDNAEHRFRHSRFFINKMIEACNEIKDSLKMDVPLTIGGITISSATIYQLVTFLERHRLTELSIDQFAGLLFGGVFAPIISVIYAYYVVKDVSLLKQYKREIKDYSRRLKRRERQ